MRPKLLHLYCIPDGGEKPWKESDRVCELYKIYKRSRDLVTVSRYYWEFQENVWYMTARCLFQIVFATFAIILELCTTLN